jgi:hypothetical protein
LDNAGKGAKVPLKTLKNLGRRTSGRSPGEP